MLSETPTNDAVNFVTGAGGFLQQVIFGWTGLRVGDGGLDPAFPALLPSHITRLVLRNVYARGKRYDVVVDSGGRRIIRAGRQLGPAPVRSGRLPGARVPGARRGRSGRLCRATRPGSTATRRTTRCRSTWSPAVAEWSTCSPTRRTRASGSPFATTRAGPRRWRGRGEPRRSPIPGGCEPSSTRSPPGVPGSSSAGSCSAPCGSSATFSTGAVTSSPSRRPPFRVAEESLLVADVAGLPAEERPRHLDALDAERLDELRARLLPTIRMMSERAESGWSGWSGRRWTDVTG